MNTSPHKNEKYEGVGTFSSALGESDYQSTIGLAAGGAIGAAGAAAFAKPDGSLASMFKIGSKGALANGKTRAVLTGALLVGAVGSVIGMFTGWTSGAKKSERAIQQFETIKSERNAALTQVEGLQTQLDGLHQEVQTHRKRFTDEIKPRAESHAQDHLAKKEHAEHAQHGVA